MNGCSSSGIVVMMRIVSFDGFGHGFGSHIGGKDEYGIAQIYLSQNGKW
jgi:hypothetical protein